MKQAGIANVSAANLYGCGRSYFRKTPEGERDIDVLFVGNWNPAVQGERMSWLGRLARMADRCHVVLTAGVFGDDYLALLRRAKIVFNRGIRDECNQRSIEATACGALLFQEVGNSEMPTFFVPGKEYVEYDADNLERLVMHYLTHVDERLAIAAAGRIRSRHCGYDVLLSGAIEALQGCRQEMAACAARRSMSATNSLLLRVGQSVCSQNSKNDRTLRSDLETAARDHAEPRLVYALGLMVALEGDVARAISCFDHAAASGNQHLLPSLAKIECLFAIGRREHAVELARRLLNDLSASDCCRFDPGWLTPSATTPVFDHFRVEWERAGWSNAGDGVAEAEAKRDLIRWKLHCLLADATGDESHYYEALLARPNLPVCRARLGCALGRSGRFAEAASHLRRAIEGNPFDRDSARALCQSLIDLGDHGGAEQLRIERQLLHKAAPTVAPIEPWFAESVQGEAITQAPTPSLVDESSSSLTRAENAPRRDSTFHPLTSFHPSFWTRPYGQYRTLLFRCTTALGDSLMLTNVVRAMKRQYPHLRLFVSGGSATELVFRHNRDVEQTLQLDSPDEDAIRNEVDGVVDYNDILARLPEYYNGLHFMDILGNVAGVHLADRDLYYTATEPELASACLFLDRLGGSNGISSLRSNRGGIVGVHLCTAKDPMRSYPSDGALVERLIRMDANLRIVVFGQHAIDNPSDRVVNCSKRGIGIREQIAVAKFCDAFICIDSAIYHVAHNLHRRPTLLLQSVTNENLIGHLELGLSRPLRNDKVECRPCYWGASCKKDCLALLGPDEVAHEFFRLAKDHRDGRSPLWTPHWDGRCEVVWDSKQVSLHAAFLKSGALGKAMQFVIRQGRDPLPEYANHWNGVRLFEE